MSKKAIAGLLVFGVGLAIAKNVPEILAEKIRKEVNNMKLSIRMAIALRVLFAKL